MNRLDWITKHNQENNNEYCNYVFTGQYLAVLKPNHSKARNDGYVYIHQLQAEKLLGRQLNDEECVHHIDENKYNNDISNLMVFKTIADHSAFHAGCEIYLENDVWVANIRKSYVCPICGNKKDAHSNICNSCELNRRRSNTKELIYQKYNITRDSLKKMIKDMSFTKIARQYGVTDNAVRAWCKKFNLPYSSKKIKSFSDKEWVLI